MLAGSKIIVTGASRGIGREIATECARQGAIVGACYFQSEREAKTLRDLFPESIRMLKFDIRDHDAVREAVDRFAHQEGGVDGLVNNAGVGGKPSFLLRWSYERMLDTIQVNLVGPMVCTTAVLPYFLKKNQGSIVNVSSVSAARPMSGVAPYAASKVGLESFTCAVAKEYGSRGIRSNTIRLGAVQTAMLDDLTPEARENILQDTFVKELPGPDCLSWLVVALLSPKKSWYVTGSTFSLDGGFLVK
jgi:3-oxoacyl-[acyl-carrier protein] reductase